MGRSWSRVAVLVGLLLGITSVAWAAGEMYKGHRVVNLVVGEKKVESDVPAIIFDDRTLLPVRALTESLGSDVKWDGETYTATVIPRPALDWGETAGKLRLHLKGIQQASAPEGGKENVAGQLIIPVQIVNDGAADQTVDLSRIQLMAADGGSNRKTFILPHVLEVSGDRSPALGTTTVALARGERVTANLAYDLPASNGVATRDLQVALVNQSGGTEAALRLKITVTIDCSRRPCTITIVIRF